MNVKWARVYGHVTKDRMADSHVIRDRRPDSHVIRDRRGGGADRRLANEERGVDPSGWMGS
jgi:hypothetical protein